MLFNSLRFLVFFPLICLGYYVIPYKFRHIFLLIASYYFYMCWNPKYALLMFTSTLVTYLSGLLIDRANRIQSEKKKITYKKMYLAGSLVINLGILFFFKYSNFFLDSLSRLLACAHITMPDVRFDIILPVGISFYTFQAISYSIDVYRGDIYTEKNFLKYALFVSFFPQLVAGPIERSKNLLKQINVKHPFDAHRVHTGLIQMLWGMFQKVLISDNIAMIVSNVYDNYEKYGSVELIFATILFAFQIYCDFGGYSNIAIGAARVMGFDLMENFNAPYLANTVADFWRRWHISLSTWFRDYLYIPLGGNRKGKLRKYSNIMIVFFVSGLWHGASWHYVVWGMLNGIYQIIGDLLMPIRNKFVKIFNVNRTAFSHRLLKIMTTFILVDISWVFFRADSFSQAFEILHKMVTKINLNPMLDGSLLELGIARPQCIAVMMMAVLIFADLCKYFKIDLKEKLCTQGIWFQYLVYFFLIFSILILGSYGPQFDESQFIYFQF